MVDKIVGKDFEIVALESQAHTISYAVDPAWRDYWLGFTEESRNLKSQQLRAFALLVGTVTSTLKPWRILDVGCGDGTWLRNFIEYDALPENLFGVDVSDIRFDVGEAKNPLINLLKTDGQTIPFEESHFDLVTQFVCLSSVPTVALRERVCQETCRVLKPGGFIFWWDLPYTVAPSDEKTNLDPEHYFKWPIRKLEVGHMPRPSECLRPLRGASRFLGPLLDLLGNRSTHCAALIGPKPENDLES